MAAGVSGNELANAAGISRNTLHLIENKAANVQLDTLGRIATALDVDPCQFFVNDTLPSPPLHRIENLRAAVAAKHSRCQSPCRHYAGETGTDCRLAKGLHQLH